MEKTVNISKKEIRLAEAQIDLLQKICNEQITSEHLSWFLGLKESERYQFCGIVPEKRLELKKTIEITVPRDYEHATRLTEFRKEYGGHFDCFNEAITDEKFNKVDKLLPNKKIVVEIFKITENIDPKDCIIFLWRRKALFTGPQGISLVWEMAKNKVWDQGRFFISIDTGEKELMFKDELSETVMVSGIGCGTRNKSWFNLTRFNEKLTWETHILCFREI